MNRLTDFSYLKNLSSNDASKFKYFTMRFKESVSAEIMEIEKSFRDGNMVLLKLKVHSLKALYQSVGAAKIESLIKSIELHLQSEVFYQLLSVELNQLKIMTEQIFAEIENEINLK